MRRYILIIVIACMVSFQNCGEIKLQPQGFKRVIESGTLPLNTSMCAPTGSTFGSPMKFLFIVDMSMSNVGKLYLTPWQPSHLGGLWQNDFEIRNENASDRDGYRFDAIRQFIETCGGSGSQIEYSIIGFSKDTYNINGNTCASSFQSANEALVSVSTLQSMQEEDLQNPYRSLVANTEPPFNLQDKTSYYKALECMKHKITEDVGLLPPAKKPIYNVYFITDGQTTDDMSLQSGYNIFLQQTKLAASSAGGFVFQPVFYKGNMPPSEVAPAVNQLNALSAVVDPSVVTTVLDVFDSENNILCSFINPNVHVNYELSNMLAVNLNVIRNQSSLDVDSDMDGVSDIEERRLGWDVYNPRSTGVLDSLCYRYSKDRNQCVSLVSSLSCNDSQKGIMVSDCDVKFAKHIFGSDLNMIDSEKDQLPDIIEILKGLNPLAADAMFEPFMDGYTNFEKVSKGLDINSSANLYPALSTETTALDFSVLEASCEDGATNYEYTLTQVPLVEAEPFEDSLKAILDLSRGRDENIILLFSYWSALGDVEYKHRVYVQKMKLTYKSKDYILEERKYLGEF